MDQEYDLRDYICPLSKVKATDLIDNLGQGETMTIVLGDRDSLKSVTQILKTQRLAPSFEHDGDSRFALTFTR